MQGDGPFSALSAPIGPIESVFPATSTRAEPFVEYNLGLCGKNRAENREKLVEQVGHVDTRAHMQGDGPFSAPSAPIGPIESAPPATSARAEPSVE